MGVPAEIRAVPRPVNTIVDDSGRDGPKRYAVRQRSKIKYVPNGNPQPNNGKVIGHIIDYKFVPIEDKSEPNTDDNLNMLSFGASALIYSVTQDLKDDLLAVCDASDAFAIMSIATLRVIKPSISLQRVSTHYKRCFVSKYYPGVALSKNSISKLLERIGMNHKLRYNFYQKRILATAENHHIIIDGTLKQDSSKVNDLSAFSYKSKIKGSKNISILYAYDIERMEPICAEMFPGNSIDASSYPAFIRNNNINKGIIIAEKGGPSSSIKQELKDRPNLHFLTPIKKNDKRIASNNMLGFNGVLQGIAKEVLCKKVKLQDNKFLYAFKDANKAAVEEKNYISERKLKGNFSEEEYTKKKDLFGVIVLESDQDLLPEIAYKSYEDHWLIELVFKHYKSDEGLNNTRVQNDFAVIGSEFINYIATTATCRIIKKIEQTNLLKEMTYGELMDDLSSAWRLTNAPSEPATDDGCWVHTLVKVFEELEALGLSKPTPKPEPKKRGRKPKPKDPNEQPKPKRPRGRPRKTQLTTAAPKKRGRKPKQQDPN